MNTPLVNPMVRRDLIASMFDDLLGGTWGRPAWMPAARMSRELPAMARARMDVIDRGSAYAITIDMPGVKKEDIHVTVEGPVVSIRAETVGETPVKEGEQLLHAERYAASYARSFELPVEVTEEGAEAAFENGVLTLTLPKRAPTPGKRLEIH